MSGRASCRLDEKQDSQKTPAEVEQKMQVTAKQTTFPGASVSQQNEFQDRFCKDNCKHVLRITGLH